ncbi:LOW QUALITY PROTEIN: SERPINE1 mRNA-binding protein 1-like [Glossina fuscipes fuscipes]
MLRKTFGVKAVDKCDGSGAQNWGSVKNIIDEVNTKKNNNEDNANLAAYTSGGIEKIDETINDQPQSNEHEHVEEEVKELTLDEWKAQQQQRAKPQFNIHKAGEGEDTSPWKKMIVLNNNKKKENESEEELEFEYDPAMYPQRVGRQQRILDIQFNFNDGRRIGSGFGGRGRGGGRGGGGGGISGTDANNLAAGGGGRGGKRQFTSDKHQQNLALKVNDERQFPTLA